MSSICECIETSVFFSSLSLQFEYQQAQLEFEIENLSWKIERAETTDIAVSPYPILITAFSHSTEFRNA